ncbi:AbrB/MazE/SpoVT family DNA-binding domain-containing protein [Halobacteriales archaeon QS_9_70_65]|nr:MAG: AbrB/MazE/SpoVT family DNA-binding domain-containing protein [Halobacteriales archaeon QS_9_70_65]
MTTPTVDSKGRIVLPETVRERLEITPGAEVTVREEGGKIVIEPTEDPDAVIERMERLVAETSAERETRPLDDAAPVARKHRKVVRRGAEDASDE